DRRGKAGTIDNVVEAGFQQREQVTTGTAGHTGGATIVSTELALTDVVDERKLLLLVQLQTVIAAAAALERFFLTVFTGGIRALVEDLLIFGTRDQHLTEPALNLRFWPVIRCHRLRVPFILICNNRLPCCVSHTNRSRSIAGLLCFARVNLACCFRIPAASLQPPEITGQRTELSG